MISTPNHGVVLSNAPTCHPFAFYSIIKAYVIMQKYVDKYKYTIIYLINDGHND